MNTNMRVLITCSLLAGLPVSGSSSASADQTPSQPAEGQASRVYADEVCMFADETNPTVSFRNVLFIMPTTAASLTKERGLVRVDNALCNTHVAWGSLNLNDERPRISMHSHTSRVRFNERCASMPDPVNGGNLLGIMPARIALNTTIPGFYVLPSLACDAHVGWIGLNSTPQ